MEEANRMLPLVRAIVRDLSAVSSQVAERRQRLAHLTAGRDLEEGDPYADELAQMQRELERDSRRVEEYIRELQQLGVQPKNGPDGIVDFPAEMDGRVVYLCWKLGEPEVLHWHEVEDGFVGRQPLTAQSVSDGPGESLDA